MRFLSQVIANELICSSEALDRIEERPGAGVAKIHEWVRKHVLPLEADRSMSEECEELSKVILNGEIGHIFG